jgi:predicted nucleic acid-binding protein
MKLLDANILLYAYDKSATHHEACRVWLESVFNADETIALPWQTILALVRISTNPRAVKNPLSNAHACDEVTRTLTPHQRVAQRSGARAPV